MKFICLLTIILCVTLSGCRTNNNKTKTVNERSSDSEQEDIINYSGPGNISLKIDNGYSSRKIHKEAEQNVYLEFNSGEYNNLYGILSSEDSTANIRFIQITMPDGTMDGPFGREINYSLEKNSNYRLSIGENMMAGDPWSGIFTVKINLENKF